MSPPAPQRNFGGELQFVLKAKQATTSFEVIDERGATRASSGGELHLEHPRTTGAYAIRVVTQRADRFWLTIHRNLEYVAPPPSPPCDRDAIDPANPNCANVHPRCNLNKPDFKNPSCCRTRGCLLYQVGCPAKILEVVGSQGDDGITIVVDKGADVELMAHARGNLVQNHHMTYELEVIVVKETSAIVVVDSGAAKLDLATLVKTGVVRLTPPDACHRR